MLSLAERWLSLRNRLIASPRFQKFAAATPGVRTIARNKARGVFDLLLRLHLFAGSARVRSTGSLPSSREDTPLPSTPSRHERICRSIRPAACSMPPSRSISCAVCLTAATASA